MSKSDVLERRIRAVELARLGSGRERGVLDLGYLGCGDQVPGRAVGLGVYVVAGSG